eukprot:3142887-Prymnesium_polylepis.1
MSVVALHCFGRTVHPQFHQTVGVVLRAQSSVLTDTQVNRPSLHRCNVSHPALLVIGALQ